MNKGLIIGIMCAITVTLVYSAGVLHGMSNVQKEWDADVHAREVVTAAYKAENNLLKQQNSELVAKHTKDLKDAKQQYQNNIKQLESEFTRRMQLHENRAQLYREQAQGGEVERGTLANNAARFDRALEEGITVVDELSELVKLRDKQIIVLGEQIRADRKVLKVNE